MIQVNAVPGRKEERLNVATGGEVWLNQIENSHYYTNRVLW